MNPTVKKTAAGVVLATLTWYEVPHIPMGECLVDREVACLSKPSDRHPHLGPHIETSSTSISSGTIQSAWR